jgi:hypothetical protein
MGWTTNFVCTKATALYYTGPERLAVQNTLDYWAHLYVTKCRENVPSLFFTINRLPQEEHQTLINPPSATKQKEF